MIQTLFLRHESFHPSKQEEEVKLYDLKIPELAGLIHSVDFGNKKRRIKLN